MNLKSKHGQDMHMSDRSLTNGFWFYFDVGEDQIAVHGSAWSGKEVVYFNDDPISETRNVKFRSEHEFKKNGKQYKIIFLVESMLKSNLRCALYVDGKQHDVQTKGMLKGNNKEIGKAIFVYFVIGMVFGFLGMKVALWMGS